MSALTHINHEGKAEMVDITDKPHTSREAVATAKVFMNANTLKLIKNNEIKKGDVLQVARIAGIMASKKTSELIPLCHPIDITSVKIDFQLDEKESSLTITSTVKTIGQTGVEMEALLAVSIAALTVYDMCKAVDKKIAITDIILLKKKGGKSGDFIRD